MPDTRPGKALLPGLVWARRALRYAARCTLTAKPLTGVATTVTAAPTTPAHFALPAWRSINAIRALAMDAVEAANAGHPGTPMALAPAAYVLWTKHLKHAPSAPAWADRDRFVLSCGHASMLQYALLHLAGYALPLSELKRFRQWQSKTPGHPERGHTVGVEITTGPLGQGVGNAVGMAMAERALAARFNRPGHPIVDHRTWAIVSDGDLMEGVASEAASIGGHLGLGKLCLLYDDNSITIDGRTELAFSEDVGARFAAYGWHVLRVDDGNDLDALDAAMTAATAESARPTLIVMKTIIADPAPTKRDTSAAHGAPLGAAEVRATKAILGWSDEPFSVPDDVRADLGACSTRGAAMASAWDARFAAYAAAHPDLAAAFAPTMRGELPADWAAHLPTFTPADGNLATRQASHAVLQALAPRLPMLVGGSADLAESTGTKLPMLAAFSKAGAGQVVHWGIREHGMMACLNGLAAHGGIRPYGSTFLVFADYLKPGLRLAALMQLPVIFIGTHDSIGVGEDGPTHQPIEQLAMLRSIPNCLVLRPADATETAEAWKLALGQTTRPTVLVLTRQKLAVLDRRRLGSADGVARGAYILHEPEGGAQAIILGTGSEVHQALAAAELLAGRGVRARVVSMPSWELFAEQSIEYRERILPGAITARVAIEAATSFGWHRWIGDRGVALCLDHFGASAPADRLYQEFGLTATHLADAVQQLLGAAPAAG